MCPKTCCSESWDRLSTTDFVQAFKDPSLHSFSHAHMFVRRIHLHRSIFRAMALFSFEKISDFATVALSFLFDKYCPIMN